MVREQNMKFPNAIIANSAPFPTGPMFDARLADLCGARATKRNKQMGSPDKLRWQVKK
jgi:hypothetical protein